MEQPDALILTGIGIGTSFSVLILLLVSVLLIRLAARLINDDEDEAAMQEDSPIEDQETRNRATAAAIAVTALLESRPYLRSRTTQERNK